MTGLDRLTGCQISCSTVGVQQTPPMFELRTVPSPGRVYTSKAAVWNDWIANKDFIVADMSSRWDGKPVNKQDADRSDLACVIVRYGKRLEKVCSINLIKNRMN